MSDKEKEESEIEKPSLDRAGIRSYRVTQRNSSSRFMES